jgi:hypothetical protein
VDVVHVAGCGFAEISANFFRMYVFHADEDISSSVGRTTWRRRRPTPGRDAENDVIIANLQTETDNYVNLDQ